MATTYEKIDPDFKVKWLKALRSGRYKQARETLRDDHWYDTDDERHDGLGYCCLGVACNVLSSSRWRQVSNKDDFGYDWGVGIRASDTKGLPFVSDPVASELSEMNDGGVSFVEIADWIEKNL